MTGDSEARTRRQRDELWKMLQAKTWMQLRECTYMAVEVLESLKAGNEEARQALEAMQKVLGDGWDGEHAGEADDGR
jgi:hypothetical protein